MLAIAGAGKGADEDEDGTKLVAVKDDELETARVSDGTLHPLRKLVVASRDVLELGWKAGAAAAAALQLRPAGTSAGLDDGEPADSCTLLRAANGLPCLSAVDVLTLGAGRIKGALFAVARPRLALSRSA